MIHLDTNFLILGLVAGTRQDACLRRWLEQGQPLAMSSVAWAEFLCGPLKPDLRELARRVVAQRLPFDDRDAAMAADLFNLGGRRKGSLGDCMIAAAAIRSDAPLATNDRADFTRFESRGLVLAD